MSVYAKRDMTNKEFARALVRHNFRLSVFWLVDMNPDNRTFGCGLVLKRRGGIDKRASLAKALRMRDRIAAANP